MASTNLESLATKIQACPAVIFDLDGTLIPSLDVWTRTDLYVIRTYGTGLTKWPKSLLSPLEITRNRVTEAGRLGYLGYSGYLIGTYHMRITDPDVLHKIRWEYADKLLRELDFKPGVVRLIKGLKTRGKKIGLATMSTAHQIHVYEVENHITSSQMVFNGYFDYVGLKDHVENNKPDPEVYIRACQALDITPNQGIAFEDSLEGVEAAKRAGLICVAIMDENNQQDFEKIKQLADFWIESFEDLANIMNFV